MEWLNLAQLNDRAATFDRLVIDTPKVDTFCTTSCWALPAAQAMLDQPEPFITQSEDGFVAMMVISIAHGLRAAVPLEIGWGLAAPFAGPDPKALVQQTDRMWAAKQADVDALLISGVPPKGDWAQQIVRRFIDTRRIGLGETCVRRIASLKGGVDGYLSRRSSGFRAKLRQARRRGRSAGISFEYHRADPDGALFERVLQIESKSWKGISGQGFDAAPGETFYRDMSQRLSARGDLRLLFVQHEARDIGFVLGGVVEDTYRGLQVSFEAGHERLEPGNLGQIEMIERLTHEGITRYDLGTDMPYKRRWAEEEFTTQMFAIMRYT